MEEEQIDLVVALVDGDALLAGEEGEVAAELDDEALELGEDGRLQILLGVGVGQPEEVQDVRVTEGQVGRQSPLVAQCLEVAGTVSSGRLEMAVRS